MHLQLLSFLSCTNHSLVNPGHLCRHFVDEVSIIKSAKLVAESLAVRSCTSWFLLWILFWYGGNDDILRNLLIKGSRCKQRHIYGQEGKNINIFADDSSLSVNPSYIRSWLQFMSTTPRMAPFLSKNDPLIMALKKVPLKSDFSLIFVHFCFLAQYTWMDYTFAFICFLIWFWKKMHVGDHHLDSYSHLTGDFFFHW